MAKWRKNIRDCLKSHLFLTQGGLETDFIFNKGYDLPYFSSFHLLESSKGTEELINYYVEFATLALENGYGYVFETATWRASKDWARLLGMTEQKHEKYLKKICSNRTISSFQIRRKNADDFEWKYWTKR